MIQKSTNSPLTVIKLMGYLLMSILFSYLWYTQYYQWVDCFNELGRCFDPAETVVYTDSGFMWLLPTLLFSGLSIMTLINLYKNR